MAVQAQIKFLIKPKKKLYSTIAMLASFSTKNLIRNQRFNPHILFQRYHSIAKTNHYGNYAALNSWLTNRQPKIFYLQNTPIKQPNLQSIQPATIHFQSYYFGTKSTPDHAGKSESKSSSATTYEDNLFREETNLGLFAKFKLMYKKYWYVLIPVHVATSLCWFGGFYYLSKSGVDIPAILEYMNFSETIIEKLKVSNMGHYAIAYLCYKIATPIRYAVTLGGTTISIRQLVRNGHIKPIPTKTELMKMYAQKKADITTAARKMEKTKSNEKQ